MSISGTIPPHITHFNDIGDVNVPAPVDGYFVYWDAAAGKWQCKHIVTTVDHLNDIGDVNVPAPADQYFFYWDAAVGKWQCRALIDADIPASIARDAEVDSKINTHKSDASAHHIKTANDEVYGLLRIGLNANKPAPGVAERFYWATDTKILYYDTGAAWEEAARGETAIRLAQLSEKAHSSLTGIGASDHHTKYTDAEAQATVKTNVEVGDLKAPTKALDMNSQRITGLAAPTAANDAVRSDANLRAPDSSKLEGSTKAQVQNHTPVAHKTRHQHGGADEINVAGLSGELADEQKSNFLKLSDTPAAYTGEAKKFARVKADESALEFVAPNLNDLADVDTSGVADDDLFYYDAATGLWKPRKLADADIPASICRDAEADAKVAAHAALTTGVHGLGALHAAGIESAGAEAPLKDFTALLNKEWYHEDWKSIDAWTQSNVGSGSVAWISILELILKTGATINSRASFYTGVAGDFSPATNRRRSSFQVQENTYADSCIHKLYFVRTGYALPPVDTCKHVGWRIVDGEIWATVGDGTNETKVDTGVLLGKWGGASLVTEGYGSSVKFYVNGVLKATISTNLPEDWFYRIWISAENTAAVDRGIRSKYINFWVI